MNVPTIGRTDEGADADIGEAHYEFFRMREEATCCWVKS
jgi:hypothetical protein